MKKYKPLDNYDFSGYAEEITGDALFLINGGAEIENSNKGVANAKPGDTLTRNDGTTVTITQGDIDWAKKQVGESETTATNSTPTSVTETSNLQPQQTSSSTSGTGKTNTTTKSGNNSTSAVSSTGTKSTESSVIQETAATAEQTTSSARTSSEYQGVPPQYWDALDEQKSKRQQEKVFSDKYENDNSFNNNLITLQADMINGKSDTISNKVYQFGIGVGAFLLVGGSFEIGVSYSKNDGFDIYRTVGVGTGVGISGDITIGGSYSELNEGSLHNSTSNKAIIGTFINSSYDLTNNGKLDGVGGIGVGGGVLWTYTRTLKGDIQDAKKIFEWAKNGF